MYMNECMILVSQASHIFCFQWKQQEEFFPYPCSHWEQKKTAGSQD